MSKRKEYDSPEMQQILARVWERMEQPHVNAMTDLSQGEADFSLIEEVYGTGKIPVLIRDFNVQASEYRRIEDFLKHEKPETHRLLLLAFIEKQSPEAIADALGVSVPAVYERISRLKGYSDMEILARWLLGRSARSWPPRGRGDGG